MTIVGEGGHARDIDTWLGGGSELLQSTDPVPGAFIGINDSAVRCRLDPHDEFDGVVVGPNTTIGPDVTLGRHTHVNGNCFVTRAALGDYVTVGPGVTICGDVQVGDRVMIGAGATVSNFVSIDDDVVVGAGAVIPPHTHLTRGTWVGVPARRIA